MFVLLQDCGPAATGEGKEDLLLVNQMNPHSMDTCTENSVSALSTDLHVPDSSVAYDQESDHFQSYVKCDSDAKHDQDDADESSQHSNPVSNLLSIEDGVLEPGLFSSNAENTEAHNGELRFISEDTSEPMETTTIIQSVPKFAQNYTLNVNSGVANIAAIQNVVQSVSSGNQTLWLPTILSNTSPSNDEPVYQGEMEGSSTTTTMSQIILTGSGQHFTTHPVNNPILSTCNSNHKFAPKVQILSSITIPKHGSIASNMKGVIHANYLSPMDITKMNSTTAALSTAPQPKQLLNNSVLTANSQLSSSMKSSTSATSASARGQMVKGPSVMSSAGLQLKSMSSVNNRPIHKLNNAAGAKVGAANPTSNQPNQQQSHVLSRVVPGPKMSLQSVGRGLKTSNSFQFNQKVSGRSGPFPNMVQSQNLQSAMPVKIIQQQNIHTNNKGGLKTMPPSRTGIGTKGSVNSSQGKSWSGGNINQVANQKQGTYTKNIAGAVGIQKANGKSTPQRLVLQQSPTQMITPNNSTHNRTNTPFVQQPSDTDGAVRYISYNSGLDSNQHVSSNQNLTAQILQSLSQPKSLHAKPGPQACNVQQPNRDGYRRIGDSYEQWRQIQ